jgi:alkanesulfonate monooxygenase SsuD/methylene tetrahydromethanopterin reductase-like flavin-dependent oxidoreductase (luciferase family)
MLGVGFADRGGRADESLALVQTLWRGASGFSGQRWAFDDAAFGPTPDPLPEVWVGGNAAAARRRARVHGDVWHPFMPDPGDVASFRAEGPTPVRPRLLLSFDPAGAGEHALAASPDGITAHLAALVGAGADGFVISLDPPPHVDGQGLRLLTEQVLPALP